MSATETNIENKGFISRAFSAVKRRIEFFLGKYRVLNFMLVGGIGFVVNMATYYPLTLVFEAKTTTFLGQQFYLPPFVISSFLAIVCNYTLNKIWTFRDQDAKSLSFLRYLSMASITLIFDMLLLFLWVTYANVSPTLGAALAIMIVFVVRYAIARRYIWGKPRKQKPG